MSRLEELIAALCPDGVEHKTIRELCDVYTGGEVPEDYLKGVNPNGEYQYPIYSNGINEKSLYGFSKKYRIKEDAVCFSSIGTIGFPTIRNGKFTPVIRLKVIVPKKESNLLLGFLKYSLEVANFQRNKSSVPNINADLIKNIVIPFPPLPVQKEIVRILDQYSAAEQELEAQLDAELEAREKQYAYYRDALLDFSPGKPRIGSKYSRLNKLIETLCPDGVLRKHIWELTIWDKKFNGVEKYKQRQIKKYRYLLANELKDLATESGDVKLLFTGASDKGVTSEEKAAGYVSEGEIVAIPGGGTPSVQYYKGKFVTADNRIATSIDITVLDNKFLFYWMQNNIELIGSYYRGSGIQHPDMSKVLDTIIPVPPLPVQKEIVRILDQFDTLLNDIKQGLPAEISARHKQYEYYRDKLLTFKEKQP